MSIDKDLLDRLMEGRSPGDLFGKTGILAELTKALAERALSTEMDVHLDEERAEDVPEGGNPSPNRRNGSSQKTVTTDIRSSRQGGPGHTSRSERQLRSAADREISAPLP